jgi:hypothetical protein
MHQLIENLNEAEIEVITGGGFEGLIGLRRIYGSFGLVREYPADDYGDVENVDLVVKDDGTEHGYFWKWLTRVVGQAAPK